MRDENKIMQFGFEHLSNIQRPITALSNRSNRLNSSVDLKIEYVDVNEVPAKNLFKNIYKAYEKKEKSQQNIKKKEINKPSSSLGFRHHDSILENSNRIQDKNSFLNKVSLDGFTDKLITKEGCKSYLRNLRFKQEDEKKRVISIAEGMRDENKNKFEYFLKYKDTKPIPTSPTKTNRPVLKDAFEEKPNLHKDIRADIFPKLLNSIRMTNFSNANCARKKETLELQRRASRENCFRPSNENYENHRTSTAKINKTLDILSISENSELSSVMNFEKSLRYEKISSLVGIENEKLDIESKIQK